MDAETLERNHISEPGRLVGGQRVDDLLVERGRLLFTQGRHEFGERTQAGAADERIQPGDGEVLLPRLEHDRGALADQVLDVAEVLFREHHGPTPTGRGRGALARPTSSRRSISAAIPASGTTASAIPDCTTNPGIPQTTLDASSCTITRAPVSDSWRAPRIPSLPIPVITIPRAWAPYVSATDRNSGSTEGRQEFSRGPTSVRIRTSAPVRSTVMWRSPGAIHAPPPSSRWPSAASTTRTGDVRSKRSARTLVNIGGMCCTIRTGTGRRGGSWGRTVPSAVGPPVETPIAITSMRAVGAAAGATGSG